MQQSTFTSSIPSRVPVLSSSPFSSVSSSFVPLFCITSQFLFRSTFCVPLCLMPTRLIEFASVLLFPGFFSSLSIYLHSSPFCPFIVYPVTSLFSFLFTCSFLLANPIPSVPLSFIFSIYFSGYSYRLFLFPLFLYNLSFGISFFNFYPLLSSLPVASFFSIYLSLYTFLPFITVYSMLFHPFAFVSYPPSQYPSPLASFSPPLTLAASHSVEPHPLLIHLPHPPPRLNLVLLHTQKYNIE